MMHGLANLKKNILCTSSSTEESISTQSRKKTNFYKTLIRPVATDGAPSWALTKDIAIWLAAFERKVLRRMFGRIK
jgi:uncharacterized protein YegL